MSPLHFKQILKINKNKEVFMGTMKKITKWKIFIS